MDYGKQKIQIITWSLLS